MTVSSTAAAQPTTAITDKHNLIKDLYGEYVRNGGDGNKDVLNSRAKSLGYDEAFLASCGLLGGEAKEELFQVSCGSGCPLRLKPIQKGDVVMDLGSGAGHDVVLASHMVGSSGRVIGLDMTEAMIDAAQQNVNKYASDEEKCGMVSFVCTTMDVPEEVKKHVEENVANVVISNGVFNLCNDKRAAFSTAHRALKPGGWFLLSDVNEVETNESAVATCSIGGDSWAN